MTLNSCRDWFTVTRMPGKFTRLALTLTVALLGSPGASAQIADGAAAHRNAVDTYAQTRDVTRSVPPLKEFKRDDYDRAIEALIASRDVARIRAAAVLHLDIGIALIGLSPGSAKFHIDIGESLGEALEELRKRGVRIDDVVAFRSTWLTVAGSLFLAVRDVQRAVPYVRHALDLTPKSAHAMTVYGTAHEIDASAWNPDDWQTLSQKDRNERERRLRLGNAERAYRDALRLDSDYAMAAIRLGRVLHLRGEPAEARKMLEQGVAAARLPFEQYVGALFAGGVLQDQKDIAGARRSYERALSFAPNSQPAVVALAHLELMDGRPDRAREIAERFAEVSADDTWWAYKDGALDVPGLTWLRAQVRP